MKVEYSDDHSLSPEDAAHLAKLKAYVQEALANGRLSRDEADHIQQLMKEDGKVTVEELRMIKATIREMLGGADLEFDWS